MNTTPTRRHMLMTGLATGLTTSTPALAVDRPVADKSDHQFSSKFHCDNTSVAVSDIVNRISVVEDFTADASCKTLPDSFEGPYFNCVAPSGKTIAEGLPGTPLTVALRIHDHSCARLPGAVVDIWACDANGRYSGYSADPDVIVRPSGHVTPDLESRFCRGVFATDADGIAEFETVYPGFYAGRAVHIHFKVHQGNRQFLTNQAHLPEDINAKIMATAPYNGPRLITRRPNDDESRLRIPTMRVIEKAGRLLATITVNLPT